MLIMTCIPAFAANTNSDTISVPKEFTITSEMVDQNGNISFEIDE